MPPAPSWKLSLPECPPSGETTWIRVDSYTLIPGRYLPIINEGVRLDWDYEKGSLTKVYKLHKEQRPHVEVWDDKQVTAMKVIQQLEK
jgi:hypothetical protein